LVTDLLRLGLIFGGQSVEHEVSVVSAQHVLDAARGRFDVVPIGVTKSGGWLTPEESARQLEREEEAFHKTLVSDATEGLLDRLDVLSALGDLDVAFPLIHGTMGEDGTLQGLLELAGIPYVGAGVAASAIGMDKAVMKLVFQQAGLDVAGHMVVRSAHYRDEREGVAEAVASDIGFPAFVKPANGGSSLGISKVRSREDLPEAFCVAFKHDRKVLVERAIDAREVECAVLGNDDPQPSPIGEISYTREFYDFEAKYLDASTQLIIPADVPSDTTRRIQDLAVRGYRAMDCAGMGRMDFFLTSEGRVYVEEINTVPGFTPGSMYPRLWEHAGMSYSDLISRLVDLAIQRHREKRRG
jgi:D-alanine-D-alanine ligase